MGLTQTVAPTAEPLSLGELKAALQVTATADDGPLAIILSAARAWVETQQNRQLMSATYALTLDGFCHEIEVPRPPLQSVTSIVYQDTDGNSQTLATSVYAVDNTVHPARIRLKYGQDWPSTRDIENAVTVTFVAGYTSAALVPAETKQAIICYARQQYDPEFVAAQSRDSAWSRATFDLANQQWTGQLY